LEGSFNPYGNGQSSMSKKEYIATLPKGTTAAEANKRWKDHINSKRSKVKNTLAGTPKGNAKKNGSQIGTQITDYKKQRERIVMNAREVSDRATKLSSCATNYSIALMCPFWYLDRSCDQRVRGMGADPDELPCIPMIPAIKSRKMQAFFRGTASVNGTGNFYIVMRPRWLANDLSNVNSNGIVQWSGPAWAGTTTFPVLDTGAILGVGDATGSPNSEYSMADLVVNSGLSGISYRIVGAGLRFRYTGRVVDQSGILHCLTEPDHMSLDSLTVGEYTAFDTYFKRVVTEDWTELTYTPVQVDEFDYLQDWHVNPTLHGIIPQTSFNASIGVIGTGLPTGDFIDFEVVVLYEVVGKFVRGKTDTAADPNGATLVLNSVNADNQKKGNDGVPVKDMLTSGNMEMGQTILGIANKIVPMNKLMSVGGAATNVTKY